MEENITEVFCIAKEADQLRRFHQALCSGSLDPQTMKMYQNFR